MSTAPQLESATRMLGADHDRLDNLLDEAFSALGRDPALARRSFASFAEGLRRHIEIEDQLLFPAFERQAGMQGVGPTAVMRREHREVETRLARIGAALAELVPSVLGVREELAALRALLADHHYREERILYPACDGIFTLDLLRAVSERLRRR
jgi:iron-sulfur cluster repair protein YtfE (RIC family)